MAVVAAAIGYVAAALVWGVWSRSKWRHRREARKAE
jgi:hypothetical protein